MSFFNNFTDVSFEYPYPEDDSHFGSGAPILGPSGSQYWYPNPAPEGYADQSGHEGSTLLDVSKNQFMDSHAMYPDAYCRFETGESLCC